MKKFLIENTLHLHESVKENRLTSYDDVNLINSSNNNNNNYKLTCIDKNIKRLDRLERGLILPLNIQKFAQRKELLNREKYNSVYKEVIFMGKERYLKYFKSKKKNRKRQ